jgi:hypothetical protein
MSIVRIGLPVVLVVNATVTTLLVREKQSLPRDIACDMM